MNAYTIADLQIGHTESFTATITEEKMQQFYALSGDNSPIHMSDEVARAHGHAGRVVYGMLGASFFSTLAGVYLPGETCLLLSVDTKFAKPIYIGDTLTISGTVSEIDETFGTIVVKAVITNQHNQKVTRGVIRAKVRDKQESASI